LVAFAHRGKHGNGHGKFQRAGEIDHEHRKSFCDVAGQQIRQNSSSERVGNKSVRKSRCFVFRGRFEFFGFLYHLYDTVIPSAARDFFDFYNAFALFNDRSRISVAAADFAHGESLSRH